MFTVQKLIQKHERAIQILDAMKTFEKRIVESRKDAEKYSRMGLDRVAVKNKHNAEIADMAFKRLSILYNKEIINQISSH